MPKGACLVDLQLIVGCVLNVVNLFVQTPYVQVSTHPIQNTETWWVAKERYTNCF
jgi:hypothetical protein